MVQPGINLLRNFFNLANNFPVKLFNFTTDYIVKPVVQFTTIVFTSIVNYYTLKPSILTFVLFGYTNTDKSKD